MDEQLVFSKIETVMTTFRETEMFCMNHENQADRLEFVNGQDIEFRSVGFEAISMCIAKECLNEDRGFTAWIDFYNSYNSLYAAQLLTGLGWALAANQTPIPLELSKLFSSEQLFKVQDGYGYYYGLFRSRLTIRSKQTPSELNNNIPAGYYSGIGRSLYYHAKGNIVKLQENIETFDIRYLHEIWQGIGTASIFLGGLSIHTIEQLYQSSRSFQEDYLIGAKSAYTSRKKAHAITQTTTLLERYVKSLED